LSLTDVACRNAKPDSKPKKLTDGAGLYLYLAPTGTKTWRVDYRHQGKRQTVTLGQYPRVTLATARAMRDELKRGLIEGREPLKGDALAILNPFQKVANEWLGAQRAAWSDKHNERIAARFRRDVFPIIGKMDIATIEAPDLLKVIRAVEGRGAQDVAARIHQTLGAIFRYGVACGFCRRDPAADLRGALRPKPRVKHMAALTAAELPQFLNALARADCEPQTRLALQLVIHTATRTNEVRFGRWAEIDGDLWRIPGERMKMGADHVIPLSRQALSILKQLRALSDGSDLIVPGDKPGKPISENRMLFLVYRLGMHTKATVHGFRSTFSTIANESEQWSADAIEKALAHSSKNAVRAAYYRGMRLDERRRLMQWWSDILDDFKAAGAKKIDTDLSDLFDV
jgi:integrase